MGDPASIKLAEQLRNLLPRIGRLKTGTPARINGNSIDYSQLEKQPGDKPTPYLSFLGNAKEHPEQICCYITHTNEKTHDIIRKNLKKSAMFSGQIESVGPRYCPSIEDKIVRFAEKTSHQIFVEPEGLKTTEVYPNGISTSLPYDVQCDFIHSMKGFEQAQITRPGYAIEYDYFDPRDLNYSLETKAIKGFFFAGQINGTTGYEEAGAQGLIAGLNAVRYVRKEIPWTPKRNEAYIGVMIDDLITRGTLEPYRMFTSRAEYRLLLREDNADLRLTEQGYKLGLVDKKRYELFSQKQKEIVKEEKRFKKTWVKPKTETGKAVEKLLKQKLPHEYSLMELLKRPEVSYKKLMKIKTLGPSVEDSTVAEQLEIQAKYAGYIDRQQTEIERQQHYENLKIPKKFDYSKIKTLSIEVKQKLIAAKPETVGIASRIPGVTPAAISIVLVYLKRAKSTDDKK